MRDICVRTVISGPAWLRSLARSARLAINLHFAPAMQVVRALWVSWIVLAGVERAWADETPAPPPAAPAHSIAIATNLPIVSIAGSVSVNLSARHAIRANVASWQYNNILAGLASASDGSDFVPGDGRTTDVALSWVFYPRHLWDGPLLDVGALHRRRHATWKGDEFNDTFQITRQRTTRYAARAMVGWSWRITHTFFIATAVGISGGRESGTWEERSSDGSHAKTTPVAGLTRSFEGYLRLGSVIEL